MTTASRPRRGSLQFYPRKRVSKVLPSANWRPLKGEGILGFITYKVGMTSAIVKDATDKSPTQNKQITIPIRILEAPNMKVYSVRFYKQTRVLKDVIVSVDKELKRRVKIPKEAKKLDENIPEGYDDIRVIAYSLPKQTAIKKKPDMIELAISADDKLALVKELISKEITLADFLKYKLVDVRGLTKGKGMQGPVKRFGITLKSHKSEKGVRNPGSIAPWHPARVTFRTPMAGQLGLFTRVHYNFNVVSSGTISENNINPESGFKNYGKIKTSFVLVKGSVQGPAKRQILLTPPLRANKKQSKKNFELIEVITK